MAHGKTAKTGVVRTFLPAGHLFLLGFESCGYKNVLYERTLDDRNARSKNGTELKNGSGLSSMVSY